MSNNQHEHAMTYDGRANEGTVGKDRQAIVTWRRKRILEVLLITLIVVLIWFIYSTIKEGNTGIAWYTAFQSKGSTASQAQVTPFDFTQATVPTNEIRAGGPGKDGIPALSNPQFLPEADADYLQPEERVIGFIGDNDEARAYPLKILTQHEIVNDRIGDLPLAVTYCPLCDSAAVFDRRTPLGEREFGVSGMLYNSNVLMYDRTEAVESLWSQLQSKGITGPAAKLALKPLPVELTTWQDWRTRYPKTKVLSSDTGHGRDYNRNPYAGYFERPELMFPAKPSSDLLSAKSRVLGIWTKDAARAYPESAFSEKRTRIEEQIDGKKIVIEFDPQARSLRVVQADEGVQWLYSLWFAWYAFHPETTVLQ